jgi:hypothetical protein
MSMKAQNWEADIDEQLDLIFPLQNSKCAAVRSKYKKSLMANEL